MLPVTLRGLAGTRLLQEYFAFPQRFLFFDIAGLRRGASRRPPATTFEIALLFNRYVAVARRRRRRRATSSCTACRRSTCSSERADRLAARRRRSPRTTSFPSAPRRSTTRCSTSSAYAASARTARSVRFHPLFAAPQASPTARARLLQRRARAAPAVRSRQARRAALGLRRHRGLPLAGRFARASLPQRAAPARRADALHESRPAAVHADRPGAGRAHAQQQARRSKSIHIVAGPSRPQSAMREGAHRLAPARPAVAQLPVAARQRRRRTAATALREILLAASRSAPTSALKRQIEGVRSIGVKPVVRRHPVAGPIAFSRGLEIRVTVDDLSLRRRQRDPARLGAAPVLRAPRLDEQLRADRAFARSPAAT